MKNARAPNMNRIVLVALAAGLVLAMARAVLFIVTRD